MRLIPLSLTLLLTASCGDMLASEQTKTAALCEASRKDRTEHAGALLADGGPLSKGTGARLLNGLAAGCVS